MKCSECEYLFADFDIQRIWYCCYGGNVNYTPELIYGNKPEWCSFEKEGSKGADNNS